MSDAIRTQRQAMISKNREIIRGINGILAQMEEARLCEVVAHHNLQRECNEQNDRAERLASKISELEVELEKRHKEYSKALNKRVDVEAQLIDIGAGKRDLPSREECMAWALKLGNP